MVKFLLALCILSVNLLICDDSITEAVKAAIQYQDLKPVSSVIKDNGVLSDDWNKDIRSNNNVIVSHKTSLKKDARSCLKNLDQGKTDNCYEAMTRAFVVDAVADKQEQNLLQAKKEMEENKLKEDAAVTKTITAASDEIKKGKELANLAVYGIPSYAKKKNNPLDLQASISASNEYFTDKKVPASPILKKADPEELQKATDDDLKKLSKYIEDDSPAGAAAPAPTAAAIAKALGDLGGNGKAGNAEAQGAAADILNKNSDNKATDKKQPVAPLGAAPAVATAGAGAGAGGGGGFFPSSGNSADYAADWQRNNRKSMDEMKHAAVVPRLNGRAKDAQFAREPYNSGLGSGGGKSIWDSIGTTTTSTASPSGSEKSLSDGSSDTNTAVLSLPKKDNSKGSEEARKRMEELTNDARYAVLTAGGVGEYSYRNIDIFYLINSITARKLKLGYVMSPEENKDSEFLTNTPRSIE
jgi:hypothetical protein